MPGYGYHFLEKPRRHLLCGLCKLLMRDPVIISTCGHRYCDTCLQEFLSAGVFRCPGDQKLLDYATIFPDTTSESSIMELSVACPQRGEGCNWTGKMFNLQAHKEVCRYDVTSCPNHCSVSVSAANMDSHVKYTCTKRKVQCDHCKQEFTAEALEEHDGNCPCEMVWCENKCGARLQQRYLSNHMHNDCHKRTQPCRYCDKSFVYETLQDHYHSCSKYLISCPNRCDPQKISREELDSHVREKCPSATVQCTFAPAGCKHLCPRYSLDRHLKDHISAHLTLMCSLNLRHEQRITELQDNLAALTAATDGVLIWKIDNIKNHMDSTRVNNLLNTSMQSGVGNVSLHSGGSSSPPQIYPRNNKPLSALSARLAPSICVRSPAFYTGRYGYKLIASAFPAGLASGAGSYFSLYIGVARGEYDNLLEWPFRYPITFTLLDQCTDTEKRQPISESFLPSGTWKQFQKPLPPATNSSPIRSSNQSDTSSVHEGGVNNAEPPMGFGYPRFVSHDILKHGTYIKDDAIFIKISVDTATIITP